MASSHNLYAWLCCLLRCAACAAVQSAAFLEWLKEAEEDDSEEEDSDE
jgi:hypothetical protein